MRTENGSARLQYYWLDKSCDQPFDYLGRRDLIFKVLPNGSFSVIFTPELKVEYENRGGISISVSQSSTNLLVSPASLVGSDFSSSSASFPVQYIELDSTHVESVVTSQGLNFRSSADAEGAYLNLSCGVVTLTNETKLIRIIESKGSVPSFRPTHILVANVLAGILSSADADTFWVKWQAYNDLRWLPQKPAFASFSDYLNSLNSELFEKIHKCFTIGNRRPATTC